ncbi:uncharacterized protein RCC_04059 [Ramularia collo-cygni]|uniref:Uncharacterized protein n=1 Tax=Ramularia collo-cygni TaxID=112498 RepID=A0A2D3UVK2_9PEZI|nr:uncharacterized protein RCC_04059 [Ramularia collo-cygni]CZT18215.1 uncharacterized protein RCC_04059 [Ramularia collo-cygni]
MVLGGGLGLSWKINPIGLLAIKYRRGGPPAPDGTRWVITNRGQKEPGMFLYEEHALWLLDMHRQSKAEAEVGELGGWGMLPAGPLREWDLSVEVGNKRDRKRWYKAGVPYEEWESEIPPPELRFHVPGAGAAQAPSLESICE